MLDSYVKAFYAVAEPVWERARQRRLELFLRTMRIEAGMSVIDLGGCVATWANVPVALRITLLNLPGFVERAERSHHDFEYVEADACDLGRYPDRSFDIAFSNSVIEHVGQDERQRAFAAEAVRLGRSYWIQTPSRYFPIEAHCGIPFWWFLPEPWRRVLIARWKRTIPDWTEMMEDLRVLDKQWLRELFPNAQISTERLLGLPKSYVVYGIGS